MNSTFGREFAAGAALVDMALGTPSPLPFCSRTTKRYGTPFVKPVNRNDAVDDPTVRTEDPATPVGLPPLALKTETCAFVIGEPPVPAGAVQLSLTAPSRFATVS